MATLPPPSPKSPVPFSNIASEGVLINNNNIDLRLIQGLSELSLAQLDRLVEHLNVEISRRVPDCNAVDPNRYVELIDDYVGEYDLNLLQGEVTHLADKNTWVTSTEMPYSWFSKRGQQLTEQKLTPVAFEEFPVIERIMNTINNMQEWRLNSCLITRYDNGVGVGYHNDFEVTMDQSSPIVVLTVGAPGKVDFLPYEGDGRTTPALSLELIPGSAYVMHPGCQERLKHRAVKNESTEKRYALSFRRSTPQLPSTDPVPPPPPSPRRLPTPPPRATTGVQYSPPPPDGDGYQPDPPPVVPSRRPPLLPTPSGTPLLPTPSGAVPSRSPTTMLLGTSLSKWVPKIRGLENISVSGARIVKPHSKWKGTTASEELVKYHESHPDATFKKVIVCYGTNDIRFDKNFCENSRTKDRLQGALCHLVRQIRRLYGDPEIVITHVLPLRGDFSYTVGNVTMYNKIVNCVSQIMNCSNVSWMADFLTYDMFFNSALYCRDGVHLNKLGYSVLTDLIYDEVRLS